MQQYHPQVRQQQIQTQQIQQNQHLQSVQQHSLQNVISGGAAASPNSITSGSFVSKVPSSTVISPSFNSTSDYVNNTMNTTYSSTVVSSRQMAVAQSSRMGSNFSDVNSSYQQHNFVPSSSQNPSHAVHLGAAGSSKSQTFNNEVTHQSGNFSFPNVIQNASLGMVQSLSSLSAPTPTPSPTPTQSPTRFNIPRASVITSDNTQQNGMFPMPPVGKFLIGDDINLNISNQSMVPDLSSSVLLPSNMVEPLPSILDPSTNQPIQISQQLQSQIESQLQLNGQSHLGTQMDTQEMYPADMLESTIGSSVCSAENLLVNDVSSNIPIISGDLSMASPLSSSVSQLDSVPQIQG